MTDYVWPDDLTPWQQSFFLQPHVGRSVSPFSRLQKTYELSAPRWISRVSFRGGYDGIEQQAAYGPRLDALLAKLKGGVHRVALYDFRRPNLRGDAATVNAASQSALLGSTSLTLVGLRPGETLLAGDYIGGDGRAHIITDDATVDAWGRAEVSIEPPISANLAGGAAVLGNPTSWFRLISDDAGDNGVAVGDIVQQVVDLEEDLGDLVLFDPVLAYANANGAVWDLSRWETDLYQDSAATTLVTADGDPVGCIRNALGDTTWDLIQPTSGDRPTFKLIDGVPRVLCDATEGMWTRSNHTLTVPTYMVAGLNRQAGTIGAGPKFGFQKANGMQYYFTRSTLAAEQVFIVGTTPTHAQVFTATPQYTSPDGTESVLDSQLKDLEVDVRLNGCDFLAGQSPQATTWTDGETVTGVMVGLNVSGMNGADNTIGNLNATAGVSFFGGAVIFPDDPLSIAERDELVDYFRAQMEPEIRSTDTVIFINGDSTSDDVDTASADQNEEVFFRWASEDGVTYDGEETLPDLNPDASIFYRNYASRGQEWTGWRKVATGSDDRRIFVSNASVPGSQPCYHMAERFPSVYGIHPHIDEHIWNHGHNMFVSITDANGVLRRGEWLDAMDKVRINFPDAVHMAIRTHPRLNDDFIEPVVLALDAVATLYGDLELVDIYQHFETNMRPSGWYNGDGVHLDDPDGIDEQLEIFVPAYANWSRPSSVTPALILGTSASIWSNSDFADFDGVPDGWSLGGSGGTVTKDTATVDRGQDHSVKISQTSGGAYLERTLDATPYQGQKLMLAVRQYIASGGNATAGRLAFGTNGTGGVSAGQWVYDTNTQAVDAWRWAYHQVEVPADATTVTVRLYAAATGVGEVYYGRAVLVAGDEPKDLVA